MAFPDAWLAELLTKNDIVSVISTYTALKPKGRRLWGLCPLHGEKTPSFSVSPDKQLFYCFGCHAGGSVIQFVMQAERLAFPEAVRLLAERAGMEMPEDVDDVALQRDRAYRERLYQALKLAARFYMETLLGERGLMGRQYLATRKLSAESVKRFGIGFSQDSWDALKNHLAAQGFTEQELLDAGLAIRNAQRDSVYDAFRGRVMFPIIGTNGRVLGFGARVIDSGTPKYINTGDTVLYNKRNNLYGLNLQKGKKLDDLVMVEGYMDVIGLFEAGVTNAVASLGTALTVQQARLLKRYVERVYIAYDGDAAGQNAMLRGLDILSGEGLDVRVIVFPDGLDPDEFVRERGREAFDALKEAALSLNAFKLENMARAFSLDNENERERFAKQACAFIGSIEPIERDRHIERLARLTGYPPDALRDQVRVRGSQGKAPGVSSPRAQDVRVNPRDNPFKPAETERLRWETALLAVMLQSKEGTAAAVEGGALELLTADAQREFAMRVISAYAVDETPSAAAILADLGQSMDTGPLVGLLREDAHCADPAAAAGDCLRRMRKYDLEQEKKEVRSRLDAGNLDKAERESLLNRYTELRSRQEQ